MPLPFQLDHINLWLLRDGDGWTIVDTGFASDGVRTVWQELLAALDAPVRRLIVTHFHPDHLGLASWLMNETGAQLWMTTGEFLTAHAVWNEVGGHGAERLAKFEKRGSGYRKAVPALPESYHRLKSGDVVAVDGKKWRILIGHGHAPEHIALYSDEFNVLISGDMLLPTISTNISVFAATPDADALGWFLESLEEMASEIPGEALVVARPSLRRDSGAGGKLARAPRGALAGAGGGL